MEREATEHAETDHGGGKRRAVKQNCYLIEIKVTD